MISPFDFSHSSSHFLSLSLTTPPSSLPLSHLSRSKLAPALDFRFRILDQRGSSSWVWIDGLGSVDSGLDWLINGFESIDRLVVALFDGSLIWFWFDGGLTVVALFFFLHLLWHVLEVEGERERLVW